MGLVPDHCNKVNIANKSSHTFFGFPVHIKVMFTLYCNLLRVENLQIINAGEGVEKREPSYTAGGNVN